MNPITERINATIDHFRQQDFGLGFRRMLDCIMDTEDMNLYREAIALTKWKHEHPEDKENLGLRSVELLEKAAHIPLNVDTKGEPVITARHIQKSYGYGRFSLGPISLNLNKGQVYGLVGENGNGKTTLLRMLAQELKLNSGDISYQFTGSRGDKYDLRTKLIYIPQRTERWYGSLKDNLRFVLAHYKAPADEIETRMMMMICRLGLWKYQELMWNELSSGYKMRFELARTLLRKPEVLLLDEPLANLDIMAQQVILEDLKYICNSLTKPIAMILSSQQLYEVEKVSDRVIFLKDGRYDEAQQTIAADEPEHLIVEFDSDESKERLNELLIPLGVFRLSYNGGVYIAKFDAQVRFSEVLQLLGNAGIQLTYIRDISTSSRRFFIA